MTETETETLSLIRMWLVAGTICILSVVACTASDTHQKRTFKETAVKAGYTATEVECAWHSDAGSSVTKANCAVLSMRK